ncbi:MAG: hypothetical protein ACXAEI_18515, partial [Candidatus Hodarchaeales archaeon]
DGLVHILLDQKISDASNSPGQISLYACLPSPLENVFNGSFGQANFTRVIHGFSESLHMAVNNDGIPSFLLVNKTESNFPRSIVINWGMEINQPVEILAFDNPKINDYYTGHLYYDQESNLHIVLGEDNYYPYKLLLANETHLQEQAAIETSGQFPLFLADGSIIWPRLQSQSIEINYRQFGEENVEKKKLVSFDSTFRDLFLEEVTMGIYSLGSDLHVFYYGRDSTSFLKSYQNGWFYMEPDKFKIRW